MNTSAFVQNSDTTVASVFSDDGVHILIVHSPEQDVETVLSEATRLIRSPAQRTLPRTKQLLAQALSSVSSTYVAAVERGNAVYLVSEGKNTCVFIMRDGKTRGILRGTAITSGFMREGDIFILSCASMLPDTVDPSKTPEDIADHLGTLYEQRTSDPGAFFILKYEHEDTNEPQHPQSLPQKTSLIHPHVASIVSTKHRRMTLGIGIVLLVMLIISVVFGNAHRKNVQMKQAFASVKDTVVRHLSEAESIGSLNEAAAAETLMKAKKAIDDTLPTFPPDSSEYKELENLRTDIDSRIKSSQHIYTLTQPDLFFDISWVKEGGSAKRLAIHEDTLMMVDTDHGNIYTVSVSKKNADILATNEEFKHASAITTSGIHTYLFVNDDTTRIVNQKGTTVIEHSDQWGTISDIEAFGGNIYALDNNGSLWKHVPSDDGSFGEGKQWIAPDISVDFSEASSMAIDGSIWVLDDTSVQKFHQTVPEVFYVKGDLLQSPKQLYTSEDVNNIYILEDTRVIVFDKTGNYQKQYLWDGFKDATDIVVTKDPFKIFILTGDKIYSIDEK